jgi:hypothetical protein
MSVFEVAAATPDMKEKLRRIVPKRARNDIVNFILRIVCEELITRRDFCVKFVMFLGGVPLIR